jgi:lycopene beta-cyclase
MIPGEAFYDEALQAIALSERIELAMGEGIVTEPRKFGDKWRIETSEGLRRGAVIVDTRPRQGPIPAGAVLWQSFSGREIECDSDMFDPTCTELMDFSARAPTPINFTYVLPMSRRRALIETTVFGPNPMTESDLANDLKTAVARQVKYSSFRILRSENGILPMGLGPGRRGDDATYVNVGLTAGGARPSTGYAFQRIQRWADSCARLIGEGKLPAGHENDSVLLKSLDYLFVSVLRSRPESAAALFFSFFEKTDAARMIRFMSDRGTIPDFAAIASVLPIFPFIREIPRAILRKALAGR